MSSIRFKGKKDPQAGKFGQKCKIGDVPAIAKPFTKREHQVYEALQDSPLKDVIPKFHGVREDGDKEYLILGDITAGFSSPCFLDLKLGIRHFDIGSSAAKRKKTEAKQKGSTTVLVGLRLIEAQMRKDGEIVKEWNRQQGLKFTEIQLEQMCHEFIPGALKEQFIEAINKCYNGLEAMTDANPGFRMYSSSVLVAYDGDEPTEVRVLLADFQHTHIDIRKEGHDPDDDEFDDGVLKGLSELLNFAEDDDDDLKKYEQENGIKYTIVEDDDEHARIKKCVVQPGDHKCILRPRVDAEAEAYTRLQQTSLREHIPILYSVQNGFIIVEDICANFTSPCIMDFRLASKNSEPDGEKEEDNSPQGLRILGGGIFKDKKMVKVWKRDECEQMDTDAIKEAYDEFLPDELRDKVKEMIETIKKAYQQTVKDNPGFRIYGASILIAYDGDDESKEPRIVISGFENTHIDIGAEGYSTKKADYDDGFIKGIDSLTGATTSQSKCCLLL